MVAVEPVSQWADIVFAFVIEGVRNWVGPTVQQRVCFCGLEFRGSFDVNDFALRIAGRSHIKLWVLDEANELAYREAVFLERFMDFSSLSYSCQVIHLEHLVFSNLPCSNNTHVETGRTRCTKDK